MEKTTLIAALVICAVLLPRGNAVRSRESALVRQLQSSAELQQNKSYYYSTSSGDVLGWPNPDAAAGNPLKGLFGSTDFTNFDWNATSVDASLEYCYIGLDELMKGDPDVVGSSMAFNWTMLETRLQGAASRNRHIVLSVVAHYPNWNNVSVPKYLLDAGLQLYWYPDFLGGGYSPDYGDPMLLKALEQYIKAFGARYDGDPRIGFVNLGLLGFWGEWHTFPNDFVPETSRQSVVKWYSAAFNTTKLQVRFPIETAYQAGFGLSDGSFSYNTLDGDANGGVDRYFYFMSLVESLNQTDFWKRAPMGGETRPEIQGIVFEPDYPAGTYERQDPLRCIYTTHATYLFHQNAFIEGGYSGEELANALRAHTRMGYNFIVSSVGVAVSDLLGSAAIVDLDVTVTQTGVAPFYYPLSLLLDCVGLVRPMVHPGVEEIIAEGDSKVFRFATIPATPECLGNVTLSLSSPYAYEGRPVKFAQGTNGNVTLDLSMPPLTENTTLVPDQSPADSVPEVQVNFTLVQIIYGISRNVVSLKNGDTLDLAIHGRELNVRANVSNEMTSLAKVRFQYNGTSHLALEPPFALMEGSVHGIYVAVPYLASTGQKTIGAIVLNKTGAILANYTIAFEVIDTSTAPPRPSPVAPPATNIFLTGHEAVPAPRHAPIKSPMAAATTSLNPVGANGNEAAATHVPTLAATFNDIHAFNTPSAPSLLELEDRQNQKKKHVTRIALTATGLGALAVVIAFYVVRMFRSSDSENDRLGTMPCFRQRRVDAINETRKKMTSRASSDDESWWSTSSSSSGNSSLAPSCDEQ